MNVNKVIHEAIGLFWHTVNDSLIPINPDYTDPVHYCALTKFMRENDRWRIFGNWLMRTYGDSQFRFLVKEEQEQVTLIAEAIENGCLK